MIIFIPNKTIQIIDYIIFIKLIYLINKYNIINNLYGFIGIKMIIYNNLDLYINI
jgi:hypothetical protein